MRRRPPGMLRTANRMLFGADREKLASPPRPGRTGRLARPPGRGLPRAGAAGSGRSPGGTESPGWHLVRVPHAVPVTDCKKFAAR